MKLIILSAIVAGVLATSPPKWDPIHSVRGKLYIPYAEIEEPFEAWYDKNSGRSRIDYYGGMVKTYQFSKEYDFGTSLKIAPITNNEIENKLTCLQVNGSADNTIDIQSILPNAKNFSLIGTETFMGYKCDKFRLEDVINEKKNVYTLWVRYVKSPKYPASRQPIPVRYEMRGFNTLLGSHYDHYYLEYDGYSHEDIPNEIFEVDSTEPCVSFPGPGHFTLFNPAAEFVHPHYTDHHEHEFSRFKGKHKKVYISDVEHEKRKTIFRQNMHFIHSTNRAGLGFSVAINHLADRSEEEVKALRGFKSTKPVGGNGGKPFPFDAAKEADHIPDQWDWRLLGAVTPVKDQSVCGSCWSFGTIGHVESAYFLKNGGQNLVRLSQQALIDCSWGFGNNGCDGGEDFRAYQWMMKIGGIPTEEEYGPYLGQDGYCHVQNVSNLVAPITGWVNVTSGDENAFKVALFKRGPLSVAIDASRRTFTFYSHVVFYDSEFKNDLDGLDHAVLAVGYGTMNGELYWLVKNSWSNYWGNDGYVLMSARDNNCGVMTSATYVEM